MFSIITIEAEREDRFSNEFRSEAEEIFFVINRECEVSAAPKETVDLRGHNATHHNQIATLLCMK
jgi:hypothetical protein